MQKTHWRRFFGTASAKKLTDGIYRGKKTPESYRWLPQFAGGKSGPAAIDAGNGFVVVTGGFKRVNQDRHRGIALFGTPRRTEESAAPTVKGTLKPKVTQCEPNVLCVKHRVGWDNDSENIMYHVIRDGQIIKSTGIKSNTPGVTTSTDIHDCPSAGTYTYIVVAHDGDGNQLVSKAVDVKFQPRPMPLPWGADEDVALSQ